jgi:catechol 2,3-dioxygenase-like lactoylglutathione lyase family enzyme
MKINKLAIVSIPVSDQPIAKAFYRDKLGFEVTRDNPMGPDQQWIELIPPGAETSITLVTWFPNMPPGSVSGLVLDTDDVQAVFDTLKERGVNVTELENAPWGQFFTFNDPDGNGWVVQQAASGA